MFARKGLISGIGRSTAMATVVAMALTTVGPVTAAFAAPAPAGKGGSVTAAHGVTDVSARRRVVHRGHRGGGGAAAAAAFAGIVGTGLAIAASQSRRDYYDGYYGGPGYYRGPGYYGGYGYGW
jgi:hypothetical protein